MKLNHINLSVTDVPGTRLFLETYFGFTAMSQEQERQNFALLNDDSGLVLTLMKAAQAEYPSTFHIGFIQESEAAVNALYQRLTEDGFEINPPQRSHNSWTFYVRAPGGILIEVLT